MRIVQSRQTNPVIAFLPIKAAKPQNNSQSEFLSAIFHELKTPISAIIGLSEILQQGDVSKDECKEFIDDINLAAQDLNQLVQDLLDLELKNESNFSVDLSDKIDAKDVIKRAVKLNYPHALRRKITIKTEVAENINPINLDVKRLKQIITNLISNSIKYSPDNTTITVTAKEAINSNNKKFLKISVKDQGFGMSEEELSLVFKKYQIFKNPNSHKVDSFGMGLCIVKELVELQKGEIFLESKVSEGTDVCLVFGYDY